MKEREPWTPEAMVRLEKQLTDTEFVDLISYLVSEKKVER